MKRILLVYPPFCTPTTPPYSITNIAAFLKNNCKEQVDVLDLNIFYHLKKFPDYHKYVHSIASSYDAKTYTEKTDAFLKETALAYRNNNQLILDGKEPELFSESMSKILSFKPDIVAISLVYSSQVFYAEPLINSLKSLGITVVIGGPSVTEYWKHKADAVLKNELELLEFIDCKKDHSKLNCDTVLDFHIYDLKDYFTPFPVLPLRTSYSCYYKRCAYCTHHGNSSYLELDLDIFEKNISSSKEKYFFLIDDMISKKRLLEIASRIKKLDVYWTCQLRPTLDLDKDILQILFDSGLKMIMWGIESGSDRILQLIDKGTTTEGISKVLYDSHSVGIKNVAYMIFGFPTETYDEFKQTINFLTKEKENIDLVSTSIFGLQEGSLVFKNPSKYCVTKINKEQRTLLGPIITYEVSSGLSQEEAKRLQSRHQKSINKLNKFPKKMNFFREHMLIVSILYDK